MNERIEELAEQAFESAHAENGNMPMMLEKFAELIVRECAEVGYDTHDDFQVKVNIKKHFGVE